jgi:hypothetical protein
VGVFHHSCSKRQYCAWFWTNLSTQKGRSVQNNDQLMFEGFLIWIK